MRPRLLDLYCGAGGAAVGYHRAGFDVVGVDIRPQPRYPFEFHRADALMLMDDLLDGWPTSGFAAGYTLGEFAAIHASPPCKRFTKLAALHSPRHRDLLTPTRERLIRSGLPWAIENVPGAPMRPDIVLCGEMFNLGVRRHRWFETSPILYSLIPPCCHSERVVSVHGMPGGTSQRDGPMPHLEDWKRAMGIDWMSARELAQAIPPGYTQFIGEQLLAAIGAEVDVVTGTAHRPMCPIGATDHLTAQAFEAGVGFGGNTRPCENGEGPEADSGPTLYPLAAGTEGGSRHDDGT